MTTTLLAPASPPPVLDLDARLALVDAAMTVRLGEAAVRFEVNTAHIEGADAVPEITEVVPLTPALAPPPCPYTTTMATTAWQARQHLETVGWCTGARRNEQGAMCLDGAIRAVAPDSRTADDTITLLLEAIQRDFHDAESVPSWNDAQRSPRLPLLYLDRAAELAHTRGI